MSQLSDTGSSSIGRQPCEVQTKCVVRNFWLQEHHLHNQEPRMVRGRQVVLERLGLRNLENGSMSSTFVAWVIRQNIIIDKEYGRKDEQWGRRGKKKMYPNWDVLDWGGRRKHHLGTQSKPLGTWRRLNYFDSSGSTAKPNVLPIAIWICTTEYFRENSLHMGIIWQFSI